MCCYAYPVQARKFIRERFTKPKRKTTFCWKILDLRGRSAYDHHQYKPGVHKCKVDRYQPSRPTGFHVYLNRPLSWSRDKIVRVVCHEDDLLPNRVGYGQAVFRKIRIREADWKAAELPKVR